MTRQQDRGGRLARLAAAAALCLAAGGALAGQQFQYSKVSEVSGQNRIELASLEDFVRLAKEGKARDIFVNGEYFYFPSGSYLYAFKSGGYRTIEDYRAGDKLAYPSGELYYLARDNGLKGVDEARYFDREHFRDGADYRLAAELGYLDKGAVEKDKSFSGLLSRKDLERNLESCGWLCYLLDRSSKKPEYRPGAELAKVAEWSGGAIAPLIDDLYYVELKVGSAPRLRLDKKDARRKKDLAESDAVLFYLTRIANYGSYAQYAKRLQEEQGLVLGTGELLKKRNMKSVAELRKAAEKGFGDGEAYRVAQFYGLESMKGYEEHRALVAKLELCRAKYGFPARDEVLLAYALLAVPAGSPIALEKLVEQAYALAYGPAQAKALRLKAPSVQAAESLLKANAALAKDLGYDAATKAVQGRR